MNIFDVEKIKNPVFAFFVGAIAGTGITWQVMSTIDAKESSIHAAQFRIYESAKTEELKKSHDLEKQYLEQKNELQAKANEVLLLRKELEVASGKVTKDKTTRLQALIEQIDSEISWKKHQLTSRSRIETDQPKSDAYLQTEKELDSLLSRRDQAQRQMIEVNAQ